MMNPQHSGKKTYGVTCTQTGKECIYIGARLLLDEGLELTVHATLAHEMLHQAINMRYRNNCKPYEKGDEVRAKEYKKVVRVTNLKHPIDDLFERALRNPGGPDAKEAELIVRPAHAEVLYANDEEKRQQLDWNYRELYDFYRNRVLPDIDQALKNAHKKAKELQKKYNVPMDADDVEYFENIRKIKRKQKLLWMLLILMLLAIGGVGCFFYFWMAPMNQIVTINDEFFSGFEYLQLNDEAVQGLNLSVDANHQVLHFKSNYVIMTMLSIRHSMAMNNTLWKGFFVNFDDVADESTSSRFWKLHDSLLQPTMVVNCSDVNETRLSSFIGNHNTDRIIFVFDHSTSFGNFTPIELNHSWSQLKNETKQRILDRSIKFQGFDSTIREIIQSDTIKNDEELRRILVSEEIKIEIGEKLEEVKPYIERTHRLQFNRQSALFFRRVLQIEPTNPSFSA
jgi:hypothetical protein